MTWSARIIAVFLLGIMLAVTAQAQTYSVTAGEHADFTRVVIQTSPSATWSLDSETRELKLSVTPGTALFDLTRLFLRIPRTRLATAQSSPGQLELTLACDCGTRAWEERPGLIVIDLHDSQDTAVQVPPPAQRNGAIPSPQPRLDLTAQIAGRALAESHTREQQYLSQDPASDVVTPSIALTRSLGLPIAQALSQGLLEPAASTGENPAVLLLNDSGLPLNLPENMRVATVIDRPNPDAAPTEAVQDTCPGAEALSFLLPETTEAFDVAFGRITRALYGEFDQPNQQARRELIELYLSSGFGAEARALITNDSGSIIGRDLLLGMSDVLEARNSNSRMRLGQYIDCGGAATLMAALAGAPQSEIREQAAEIALVFTELQPSMRSMTGPDLAAILIDAEAVDAARIVAGSTHRSPWTADGSMDVVDALLDRARGNPADAAARLEYARGTDAPSMQARMNMALEAGHLIPFDTLMDAEALASTERRSVIGSDLMIAVIRLHTRAGSFEIAFNALDRLETWAPQLSDVSHALGALRDGLWNALAQNADDHILMRSVLGRDDWSDPALSLETRQLLAERLLQLGLGGPVRDLLGDAEDDLSTVLRARAFLALEEPQSALELVSDPQTAGARRVYAAALSALGQNELAAQAFEVIQATDEAQHTAVLAQDWGRVQRLGRESHAGVADDAGRVGQVLGYAPGHLEHELQSTEAPAAATQTFASQPESVPQRAPERAQDALDSGISPAGEIAAQSPAPPQAVEFDRLGLITRSATLLDESARLRDILTPLAADRTTPRP